MFLFLLCSLCFRCSLQIILRSHSSSAYSTNPHRLTLLVCYSSLFLQLASITLNGRAKQAFLKTKFFKHEKSNCCYYQKSLNHFNLNYDNFQKILDDYMQRFDTKYDIMNVFGTRKGNRNAK